MRKLRSIITLTLLLVLRQFCSADERTIKDVQNGNKLIYEQRYYELKNNRFNLFNEVDIDYPVLKGYQKANEKIYYHFITYLGSDSFKLDLLQRSKLATSIFLNRKTNRYSHSQYTYNNYEKFLPMLTDVNYEMVFLYDNLLAIRISYKYKLGDASRSFDEEFRMEKMLFVSLSDSKVYTLSQLFTLEKAGSLSSMLEKKARTVYSSNKKAIDEEMDEEDEDGEDDEEEDEEGNKPEKKKTPQNPKDTAFDLDELNFSLSPFGTTFTIPPFSLNSSFCGGASLQLNFTVKELKPYIHPKGPLQKVINYQVQFATNLKNCNLYRENRSDWQTGYNLQRDNNYFLTAPVKGIRTITQSISYKNQPDSSAEKQRLREFDRDGHLVKEVYFNSGAEYMTHSFEYNKQGLLSKIVTNEKNKKGRATLFTYDANNNLSEKEETAANGNKTLVKYFYDGNTAYEITEDGLDQDERIREYHLNEYGKIVSQCNFGEEAGYEILYDKEMRLGVYTKKRPNLDNSIFCYSATGKLLTYQHDNGRHLYELIYDPSDKVTEVIHMDSRQIKDIWKYSYDKNGLLINFIIYNNVYNYSNMDNLYRYKLDYTFY